MTRPDLCAALSQAGIVTDDPAAARDAVARLLPERTDLLEAIDEQEPESSPRERLELRASRMPLAFECPGSVRIPSVRIRESGAAADLGTAVHSALRQVAELGYPAWDALPALATQHKCDPEELRMLVAMGAKLWKQVEASFPNATTEVPVAVRLPSGHVLTGTADIVSVSANAVRVWDWKSGRKDTDHSEQLRAYAAMVMLDGALMDMPLYALEATATIGWIREQEIENLTITRDDSLRWIERLESEVIAWDGTFHPGERCAHCPRGHECEARSTLVVRSIGDLMGRDNPGLDMMEPSDILALHERVKLIESVAGKVASAIRSHVETNGDVVANGKRLTIATENRRALDVVKAFEVLSGEGFGDAEWAKCMTISASKAEAIVADQARAAGQKIGAAVEALGEKLSAAGAVRKVEIRKLTTRRV